MIGKGFLYTGVALLVATALKAIIDLLQTRPTDPWVFVFAAGCIAASIGFGLAGIQPWRSIQEWTDQLGRGNSAPRN